MRALRSLGGCRRGRARSAAFEPGAACGAARAKDSRACASVLRPFAMRLWCKHPWLALGPRVSYPPSSYTGTTAASFTVSLHFPSKYQRPGARARHERADRPRRKTRKAQRTSHAFHLVRHSSQRQSARSRAPRRAPIRLRGLCGLRADPGEGLCARAKDIRWGKQTHDKVCSPLICLWKEIEEPARLDEDTRAVE